MSPVFSIITITYNAERWIERTLRSVEEQTYPEIEYLIIDGASTDETMPLIHGHEGRITSWTSEPDKGIYDAMNKGLRQATGDYVWFLNAGDEFAMPDTLRLVAETIQHSKDWPDILYGETDITNENGEVKGRRRLKAPEHLDWQSFRHGMLVCHQSFIVRKDLAPAFDLRYRYSSDFDWCIRCLQKANGILNTHLTLSRFLDGGTSSQQRKVSLFERYRIMCHYYGRTSTTLRHLWFALRFFFLK
ncbi:MAG: glycosyltransferase [Tannerella sp.]|jgi:glycosyltransferase involved in cell wall biosynthesis|nr:glycosyltransferase [Tannerella sp.]